jgi:UDP-N-acetylmuramate--alanine ligase
MRVATFAETLGAVFNTHHGIAVAGSHGKTTVTAWLGFVMKEIGMEPSVMVGAEVPQFNGAGLYGSSNYLVIEADEYQNKLQYFNPKMILLNNIDYDHPDFFKDEESYEKVFADFIGKLPKSGILVANFENKTILKISQTCQARVASYGFSKKCDYQISETSWDGQRQYFNLKLKQDDGLAEIGNFSIQLNGEHNILNATAVIVACIELGADLNLLRRALDAFTGTARRLQILGSYQGALIVDDYAHHPTEIKASLAAATQKWPKKKIRVVFHPHTFSRTAALLDEFAVSFKKADEVIVLDIYQSARETSGTITSEQVAQLIKENLGDKKTVKHIATLEEAETYLRETAADNVLILLMGAGDVFRIGERLLHDD